MSFIRYAQDDSVVSSETVVRGLFSNDQNSLSTFFIGENNLNYMEVRNLTSSNPSSSAQFTIQYGNKFGSGSALFNPLVTGSSPTRTVYGQYRNLVYGTETKDFSFDGGLTTSNEIWVINFSRARYKESLLPGSFNMGLRSGSTQLNLTDDSKQSNVANFIGENRYYNIVSGSNGSAYTPSFNSVYYGMLFPDLNIIILNTTGSGTTGHVGTVVNPITGSFANNNNNFNLFRSISSSAANGNVPLQLQSAETVSSRYFFTRVKNSEFNYTTNPSIIDENGNLLYPELVNSPQTYVTSVGLYNDNNELLAIAKLSKPLVKDFTKEALIRVKLDY